MRAAANYGAYVSMFAPTIPTTGLAKVISGLYRIPAIRVDFDCAFTNTVPVDAIRGAGKPEALFLLERLVDLAAAETGRSPIELRDPGGQVQGRIAVTVPLESAVTIEEIRINAEEWDNPPYFSTHAVRVQEPAASPVPEVAPETSAPLDDRTREEVAKDENTFDPNSFSL